MQEVFYRYKAVEIFVQGEKGLPNLFVVACNFSLYFLIQLLDSLRKNIGLPLLILTVFPTHLFDLTVFVALVLLVKNVQLWEKDLTKLVK